MFLVVSEMENAVHFYSNLFESIFFFCRNVLAVLGLIFGLVMLLEWRRDDGFAGQSNRAYARENPVKGINSGRAQLSPQEIVEESRLLRSSFRQSQIQGN